MNSNVKPDVLKIHSDDDDDERDKYSFDVMKQNKNPQYVYDTEHRVNNDAKDETPEIDDHNETTLENDIFCEKNRQKSKKCSDLKEISRKDNFTMENRYSFDGELIIKNHHDIYNIIHLFINNCDVFFL